MSDEKLSVLAEMEVALGSSEKLAEFRLLDLLDFVRDNLDDLIHEAGGVDAVVVAVNRLYDLYVAPIDVPWIIEPFETLLFDASAKRLLETVVRRIHDRVHEEG